MGCFWRANWRYHYLYTTALAQVAAIEKFPRPLQARWGVRAGVLWVGQYLVAPVFRQPSIGDFQGHDEASAD